MEYNVIWWNINSKKFEKYNIIPHLIYKYEKKDKKPKTFDEFKEFIKDESMYQWWSRCEYEILLSNWPSQHVTEKWDIHDQIMMNIDTITQVFMSSIITKYAN